MGKPIMIEIAPGELLDKLSILEIKLARITDPKKLAHVRAEHQLLAAARGEGIPHSTVVDALFARLKQVNATLWDVEDDIREEERAKRFGERFVELARAVYVTNDQRAAIKQEINLLLESQIVEEKSYASYR